MLFEVGQDGAYGTVKEVEQMGLYDFMYYLGYLRAQNKYRELTAPKYGKG